MTFLEEKEEKITLSCLLELFIKIANPGTGSILIELEMHLTNLLQTSRVKCLIKA